MKRLMSGLLAALLALVMLSSAFAAGGIEPINLYISEYVVNEDEAAGDINMIFYDPDFDVDYGNRFQVSYGSEGASVTLEPMAFSASGAGITHVYIVDVASRACNNHDDDASFNYGNRISDFQTTIKRLFAENAAADNAVVVATGADKLSGLALTSDEDKLYEQLNALKFNEGAAGTLMDTLNKVCNLLSNSGLVKERINIYLFSNGYTDACDTSILKKKLEDLKAAVYTFAYFPNKGLVRDANKGYLEAYQNVHKLGIAGAHVESSYNEGPDNGRSGNLSIDPATQLPAVINAVKDAERSFGLLRLPVAQDMENLASVTVSTGTSSCTFALNGDQQSVVNKIVTGEGSSVLDGIWKFVKDNWLLCSIGGVLLILIIVLLLVVFRHKDSSDSSEDISVSGDVVELGATVGQTIGQTVGQDGGAQTMPVLEDTLNVRVDRITQGDVNVTVKPLTTSSTIMVGRDANTCQIVFSGNDTVRMSRRHAKLQYQPGGMMMIENMSSNGTKVNNEKINRPTVLQQNDLVTFGDVTVRITWWINK